MYKNPLVCEIVNKLKELSGLGRDCTFIWVKGHHGVQGNEVVDRLAKIGSREGEIVDFTQLTDLLAATKKVSRQAHERHWAKTLEHSNTQLLKVMPKMPSKPLFDKVSIPRYLYTALARIMVGHGAFKSHMFRLKLADNPFCDCDFLSICDLNHIILNCPKFESHRKLFLCQFFKEGGYIFPTNLILILRYALGDMSLLKVLLKFICDAKIHLLL